MKQQRPYCYHSSPRHQQQHDPSSHGEEDGSDEKNNKSTRSRSRTSRQHHLRTTTTTNTHCQSLVLALVNPIWQIASTSHLFLTIISLLILIIGTSSNGGSVLATTCPEQYCSSPAAEDVSPTITYAPKNCDSRNLELVTLNTFQYNDETLMELLGPSDSSLASSLVITATHGGSVLLDNVIDDRRTDDPDYCPSSSGCNILKDSNTIEMSLALAQKVMENYCEVPHVIINHLHRRKLDANREIGEAAQGNAVAQEAWNAFHSFIAQAQQEVMGQYGTVWGATEEVLGVKGLLLDVHGYAGYDWDSTDGSKFIQWGYRLSKDSLDPNLYCPLDDRISSSTVGSTISTFTHARDVEDGFGSNPLECLIRGPSSIASRVNAMLPPAAAGSGGSGVVCGTGLPSFEYPSPKDTAQDPNFCKDHMENCHYYSGGYVVDVHENLDWQQTMGGALDVSMNTVQAEFPRCLRFGDVIDNVQSNFAHILSIALYSFMRDLYGPNFICVDSTLPMRFKRKNKTCAWAGRKNTEKRCNMRQVASHCPLTCGKCFTCSDSYFKFRIPGKGIRDCKWVGRVPDKRDSRCSIAGVRETCQAICGYCSY